jgi:hypothetical protein
MNAPVPKPKSIKVYAMMTMIGTKFSIIMNTNDPLGNGLWATQNEAQAQQLIETMKLPSGSQQKFEIYELEWPTPY